MATNVYEGMFILDSNWYARDPGAAGAHVQKMIEDAGGEVLASRLWEDRRLAYPIKNRRRGAYWLTYFRLDSVRLNDIYKACNLSDHALRALLLKVDARIADTLVEHARSASSAASAKPPTETTASTETEPAAVATEEKTEDAAATEE
ncbi:MAG: 30S ribosomal protein S6 [Pirellulales bacterium]|nr:30S ribosomal protein S6 [Pirellulales bacterium]